VILFSSSYLSQNNKKILWMHPQGPTQESRWRELSEPLKVMWVWWAVFVAQLACVGVPGCALRALWLFGMITLAKYVLALLETGCWCEHVQPLRSFISACICLKASWLQSSITVKWSKSSKVHQQIITCLHHGKFAGAKVKFPSTHDGISSITCLQHATLVWT